MKVPILPLFLLLTLASAGQACEDLAEARWIPLHTGTLANGTFDFTDPDWPNHPGRFYRIRSP